MSLLHPGEDHRRALAPLSEFDEDAPGWDDQQVGATLGVGGAALATVSLFDTPAKILGMANNGTDSVTFYAQLPHRWDRGLVRPHVHWIPLALPGAPRTVRFNGQYAWAKPNALVPLNTGWTSLGNIDVPVAVADYRKHFITSLGILTPPADAVESHFLIIHFIRDGASATDDYTDGAVANVGLLGVDVHFRAEKLGTYNEFHTP